MNFGFLYFFSLSCPSKALVELDVELGMLLSI